MDSTTLIRIGAAVLFAITFAYLIRRRRKKVV